MLRLVLAGVWVLAAVGLWLRPTAGGYAAVGPLLALGFAGLNVARWRAARPPRVAMRVRQRPAGGESNPAFDFGPK